MGHAIKNLMSYLIVKPGPIITSGTDPESGDDHHSRAEEEPKQMERAKANLHYNEDHTSWVLKCGCEWNGTLWADSASVLEWTSRRGEAE